MRGAQTPSAATTWLIANPGEHHVDSLRDCALSVANEGPHTLEEVAQISGVTREWVRQLEVSALEKLAGSAVLTRQYDAVE